MPASARLATVATDIGTTSHRRATRTGRGGLPLAGVHSFFQLIQALLQLPELRLRVLEARFLELEVLSRDEVHALKPARQKCPHVFLEVLRRGIPQRLGKARVEVFKKAFVDHGRKGITSAGAPIECIRRSSAPNHGATAL